MLMTGTTSEQLNSEAMKIALFERDHGINAGFQSIEEITTLEINLSAKFGAYEAQQALANARRTLRILGAETDE